MLKKQKGFGLIEVFVCLAILGVAFMSWQNHQANVTQPNQEAAAAASYVDSVSKSTMAFYLNNRRWPANIDELQNANTYFGNTTSIYGTTPVFSVTNGLLAIQLETNSKAGAARLKQHLTNKGVSTTRLNDTVLSLYIAEPTENSIQSYFLARREVPGCPSCNTMETDIDANGYDIKQIKELTGDRAEFENGQFDSASIDNLTTEAIRMAGVIISGNGNQLNVNADEVNITGNINGNGGQFDHVQADTVRGNEFYGDDFVTDVTTLNETKELFDEIQQQMELCRREGNCRWQ